MIDNVTHNHRTQAGTHHRSCKRKLTAYVHCQKEASKYNAGAVSKCVSSRLAYVTSTGHVMALDKHCNLW